MKAYESYKIKDMVLKNRIVMPPMCMYSSDSTGKVNDFHFIHYATRAIGGVGLVIVEATGVAENGRISDKDLGIWSDEHIEGLKSLVEEVKKHGAKIAIQLNHGGRKYEGKVSPLLAPSSIAFDANSAIPKELTKEEIRGIVKSFKLAAERALKAGFDAIEIHGAHGYLISEFLSPISNKRTDEYGGSTENRSRFLKEVLQAVREVWPKEKPILLRISASDFREDGMTPEGMAEIIKGVKQYIDIVHVSAGGVAPAHISLYPGYQVKFSEIIKEKCSIPTIAVGLITDINMVEEILSNGRADLVSIGRELLRNPYFPILAAKEKNVEVELPEQYRRSF